MCMHLLLHFDEVLDRQMTHNCISLLVSEGWGNDVNGEINMSLFQNCLMALYLSLVKVKDPHINATHLH